VYKFSKSAKKFVALAGAASAFVMLPVLAQANPAPSMHGQPSASDMQTRPQGEAKPMAPSSSPAMNSTTTSLTVVEVAAANGSFKTLTAALKATGLDQALAKGGPYTIFAPTDKAFAALPKGALDDLLKPENRASLVKILTYHVVPGENTSRSLQSGETKTLEGAPVRVNVGSSGVMVNDAKVVQPDIKASNGVIHVIDKVIMPPTNQSSSGSSPR
jgi:uncharacterized surface protein with fasciclin (FAS1) repeats